MTFEAALSQPPALLTDTMRVGRGSESPDSDMGCFKVLFIWRDFHSPSKRQWKGSAWPNSSSSDQSVLPNDQHPAAVKGHNQSLPIIIT